MIETRESADGLADFDFLLETVNSFRPLDRVAVLIHVPQACEAGLGRTTRTRISLTLRGKALAATLLPTHALLRKYLEGG